MSRRKGAVVGLLLLALAPVGAYAANQTSIAAVAVVNVALIVGCLYVIFSSEADPAVPAAE